IRGMIDRVAAGDVAEIILAVNATVEGQTTAHYLTDQLSGFKVKVTRLAHGVPVGGELDYLDEGTRTAALKTRAAFGHDRNAGRFDETAFCLHSGLRISGGPLRRGASRLGCEDRRPVSRVAPEGPLAGSEGERRVEE